MMHAPRFATAFAFATLLAMGCGDDPLTSGTTDTVAPADTEVVIDLDAVVTIDTAPIEPVDTLSPGDGATTDTAVVEPSCDDDPLPFFCPCQNNSQCDSGYCVAVDEDEVSARCSRTCNDTCPSGWDCRGVSGGGDPVFICQPPIDNLCKPCTVDANCGAVGDRCVAFEDGDYCGQDCQGAPDSCPPLYACGEVTNSAGQILAYQCLPESGSCNCPVGTDYANDPEHCGGCNKACAFDGGVAGCASSSCFLADCLAGFVNLDGEEFNGCEYACTEAAGEDWPDAVCNGSSCDQDCDGLDGSWARGVFVSATGNASGAGTPEDPTNTITKGIDIAHTTPGKDHVYIAAGTYNEQVTVREGVSLFGGYSNDGQWRRSLAQFQTVVTSSSGVSSIRAMIIDGVQTTRTVIDGLTVNGGTNANPGGSSYAIWVRNSSTALELIRVTAVGGAGGTGASGSPGSPGNPGNEGVAGTSSTDWDYIGPFDGCDFQYAGKGGPGATNACASGINAGGGAGATPPHCANGASAGSASPGGTPGGPAETAGTNGSPGADGQHGSGALAGGSTSASGFWSGQDGGAGATGANGRGGGGGGSGRTVTVSAGTSRHYGGGGGGGGGGGCAGTHGTGGRAGGGSFGVFLHDASPKLVDSALGHKSGGNGGAGGLGGNGGVGRTGKPGGNGWGDATNGRKGGDGGKGGNGGHGGGGAGGVAYGLYISGTSSPSCSGLSFSPPGAGGGGGIGGVGGTSAGNRGSNGAFGDKNKSTASCP